MIEPYRLYSGHLKDYITVVDEEDIISRDYYVSLNEVVYTQSEINALIKFKIYVVDLVRIHTIKKNFKGSYLNSLVDFETHKGYLQGEENAKRRGAKKRVKKSTRKVTL